MGDPPATPTTQISLDASPSVASSSGANIRKERGAIAAQACDTCRSRKQRCDEQRPKCGTCQKFRLECNYREPIPTKKDRTLVEILDRLKGLDERLLGLETKVDHLSHRGSVGPPAQAFHHLQTTDFASSANPGMIDPALTAAPFNLQHGSSQNAPVGQDQYKYVSSVHQMLGWPAVQQLFASIQGRLPNVNFSSLERDGVSHMLGVHRTESQGLPSEGTMRTERASGVMSTLTWENVRMWSQAYFDTTNLFYPILDRQSFMQETLPSLFRSGFSNSISSTIALLVFALGEVSLEGREGAPVHVYNNGRRSGVKGGTKAHPPGLALFNEARSRMGFDLTECSLENVQIFALASAYYGSCFYPMDFWRMTASASLAFQALITSNPGELSSPRRDLIRRAFWHCSILETSLNLELGFPLTGLERMENTVGLPDFSGPFCEDDVISNQQSHFQEHFASQIVLRRLLVNFHNTLNSSAPMSSQLGGVPTPFNSANNSPSLSQLTIQQLASQLEEWRGMLPPHLRWQEDYPGAFPNTGIYSGTTHTPASTPISPSMSHTSQPSSLPPPPTNPSPPLMFTTDLDSPPAHYPYVLDVQVALLRSRYYYTKYLIHRPFLYKALHYPDSVTQDDALGAAECLKASLKWPVAMSPTCKHKRLVPCMFFFTQNFFGILVLLHLSTTVPLLRRIRSTLCGERFEMDASETVGLYLDWLRDLKPIDAGTAWHWEVVRVIYGLEG